MVFSSMTFMFAFLPIVMIIYYIVPQRFKNLILAASGVFFYAWGEPFYVLIMLLTIAVDFFAGLLMEKFKDNNKKRLAVLLVSVVLNLGFLGVFKYGSFVINNINSLFGVNLFDPQLALPIGISFYTFQAMSYTIDLYKGKIAVQKNIISFTSYVTMFPQLIAGPIVRYSDVDKELNSRRIEASDISEGIGIFIRGLAKKVLLANQIGAVWTAVKALDYQTLPALTAWIGIIAFAFQIYYDFAGYSDMAIGLGRMLGFHFPQNFNLPYLSKSITEFWRRWHMTLGGWFRSYVYIPLGGNRCSKLKNIRNILIVWGLTGLWHGAAWNFVLWGVYFGVILILEKFVYGKYLEKLPSILQHVYSVFLILLGWVWFEMSTLQGVSGFLSSLFGVNNAPIVDSYSLYLLLSNLVMFVFCFISSTHFVEKLAKQLKNKSDKGYRATKFFCEFALFAVCVCYLVTSSYNPFLYLNF